MSATMAISKKQAIAVAKSVGARVPDKDNGWIKIENAILRRLPNAFRKRKAKAHAYRLSAKNHEELSKFHKLIDENGRNACIVWRNED